MHLIRLRKPVPVIRDRIDEMAKILAKIADVHHRTIDASRLHKPQENPDFWKCNCLTCVSAAGILIKNGYSPEDFIEYPDDENKLT